MTRSDSDPNDLYGIPWYGAVPSDIRQDWIEDLSTFVVDAARDGDQDPLSVYLERGWPLTEEVRAIIIKFLQGVTTRRRGRPRNLRTEIRHKRASEWAGYLVAQGFPKEAAVAKVENDFNLTNAYRILRRHKDI